MAGLDPGLDPGFDPATTRTKLAKDAIPVCKHPMEMAGSSPAMTGLAAGAVRQRQGRLVLERQGRLVLDRV